MDIDLGNEIIFNVKLNGQSYKLREPTYKDIKKLNADKDNEEASIDLLCDLGLPKEVADGMGVLQLTKLIKTITGSLEEKK